MAAGLQRKTWLFTLRIAKRYWMLDPTVQSHTAFAKYICVNSHESGIIPTHTVNFVLLWHVKTGDGFVLFVQGQLPL